MEWLNCININLYNVMGLFIEIYPIGQRLLCTTLTIDHMALTIDHMDHVTLTVDSVLMFMKLKTLKRLLAT